AELRAEVEARAARLRAEVRRRRDRIRARIEEVLGQLEQVVPRAQTTSPQVRTRGRTGATEIDGFLTGVITSVDAYWTRTFAQSGLPTPSVSYQWVAPGERASTGCRVIADDGAAFYCPGDDTIYVAQRFAADLYRGVARGLPGERAGYGRAAGDFGVAYVVAHEYAHNLQAELGYFTIGARNSSKTFELQADCMAGSWGNSVYKEGLLQPGDVEEAMDTALAVGDFDVSGENHHGTPRERQAAWLGGFRSGDPSVCDRYVPR
ncbi:MAG: neutral zinc metallopeptidase, partial [Solirubrobacterales bacterium]|nr:neutral zinc metallopeptidase [Solirubrobacterales bacterium]